MRIFVQTMICALGGYLVGCFNPAYLFSKKKGCDIREMGSGNAGASNTLIVFGKKAGFAVAIIDIFKTVFIISTLRSAFPDFKYLEAIAGASCILGHMFPIFMDFHGGKGLACLGGTILAIDGKLFIILLIIAIAIAVVTNYICFVPIVISVLFPIIYGFVFNDWLSALILFIPAIAIWHKHQSNLARIKEGKELGFNYLWNKDIINQNLTDDDIQHDDCDDETRITKAR